tara:strand:+ start:176 stop:439 length:264 start_codon:yes stop_codon:yes gene_type:complete
MAYTGAYNGWTNYETWRVNLEIFDDFNLEDHPVDAGFHDGVAEYLKETAEELVMETSTGLGQSYAMAFMANVNWHEIAKHLMHSQEA